MDSRFIVHNTHWFEPLNFAEQDPQLRKLSRQIYVHHSKLLEQFPTKPGIYTLGGGRQIGKSTLLKQWMVDLLNNGIAPIAIAFLSGELIDDQHALLHLLQSQLAEMPSTHIKYILLDEVTYIRSWDKAIKYAADAGMLEQVVLMLTGSDLVLMNEARMTFPGRRGKAAKQDFHLYPLSFYEFVNLVQPKLIAANNEMCLTLTDLERLFQLFEQYLQHGGYLTAINDLAAQGEITIATLLTYSDWIRGDVIKRGKQEHYLREILTAMIKRYNSQITWNALARDLSIDHPKTVADYVALLESMDAVYNQAALLEDKLTAAPKKARKIIFTDPFIYHAIKAWLRPVKNPYEEQILTSINTTEESSRLVEACVVSHFRRFYPTYYIKAEGEVDVAYINQGRFWPIEIKWTNQLHAKDLKQIAKYSNSRIWAKIKQETEIQGIKVEPLPVALLGLVD